MQEYNEKKSFRETQTLRAGCSKAEPKIFAPPQTASRGVTENAGMENAGLENVGQNRMGGNRRTGKRRTKIPVVEKAQDWKTREHHVYG